MEVLLVVLAGRRYALPSQFVDEVVPRTRFTPIDRAPRSIAGLMDHRGTLIPIIDGAQLLHDQDSPPLLGSRIVVLEIPAQRESGEAAIARFGLLCDLVTERTSIDLTGGGWQPGTDSAERSVISGVGRISGQPMELIDPARIIVREKLLRPTAALPNVVVSGSSSPLSLGSEPPR